MPDEGQSLVARDYRDSHVGEGQAYHEKFVHGPYRAAIWELEQGLILELLDRWLPDRHSRHLDFACGTGRILGLLEQRVGSATGVDVSESMLGVARQFLEHAELHQVDLTRQQIFESASFDLITAFRFFPNAEPPLRDEVMSELSRLLAPDGVLILNNHLRRDGTRVRARRIAAWIKREPGRRYVHCMSDAEVVELAGRHGLAIVDVRHLGLLPILKEKSPLLPRHWIRRLEGVLARIPWLARFASFHIYVLKHSSSARAPRTGR